MAFSEDLANAQKSEVQVANYFVSKGMKLLGFSKGEDLPYYDFAMETPNGIRVEFELKEDIMCHKTGNVAIEFSDKSGKPTGISRTRATYYLLKIHCQDGKIRLFSIPVKELVFLINNKKYSKIVEGGDDFNSIMYLFNYKVLTFFMKFITELKW